MKTWKIVLVCSLFAVQVRAQVEWKPYGFILPTWIGSNQGIESFSQPNGGAHTAALNPAFRKSQGDGQAAFQISQSRLGFQGVTGGVTGTFEFDFIDFAKATPQTAANPRLRRAFIEWKDGDSWKFKAGQEWDLASPLAPYTYNLVGHYFESGDIGFMRIQFMALRKHGDLEEGFAVGLPSQNSAASYGGVESSVLPTVSFRETWELSKESQIGLSAIGTAIRRDAVDTRRMMAGAVTFFAEHKNDSVTITSELYAGQNTYNLGMLGLSFGSANHPQVREAGGYVTGRWSLSEKTKVFGGAGGAFILQSTEMEASYSRSSGIAVLSNTGPGLERNWTTRLGIERSFAPPLTGFIESNLLVSHHHLIAQDMDLYSADQVAALIQLGVIWRI